jgi:hypothetical protein
MPPQALVERQQRCPEIKTRGGVGSVSAVHKKRGRDLRSDPLFLPKHNRQVSAAYTRIHTHGTIGGEVFGEAKTKGMSGAALNRGRIPLCHLANVSGQTSSNQEQPPWSTVTHSIDVGAVG